MIISSRKFQHNNRKKFFTGNIKLQLLSNKESSLRHGDCLKIHTKSHFSGFRTMTAVTDTSLLQTPIPLRKTVPAKLHCAAHARFSHDVYTMNALKFAFLPALLALSVCQTTNAGTATASFQTSLVIQESCTIVSQRNSHQVQCRHNTPYLIHQQAMPSGDGLTVITF
ncbi:hypothetical protein [Janthinobacterium sp.]|uniref:hypothetical protein n=1 Tax=Janthinobacterium sp. TaxID=1871054 RepID=UPI0026309C83|nr:hypothetical protein [Janthinobacterium sp.]